jgi:hypothetical protein
MNKIVSIVEKLKKIPAIIWFAFVSASYIFANLYITGVSFLQYNDVVKEVLGENAAQYAQMFTVPPWLVFFTTALIGGAIFELILHLVYRSLYIRTRTNSDAVFFKTAARLFYAVSNVITGLYGLIYLKYPGFFDYGSLILNFAVYTAAYTLAYLVAAEAVINPKFVAKAFINLYYIYFGIYILFSAVGLIDAATGGGEVSTIIGYSVRLGLVAIFSAVLYFTVYKKLKEKEKNFIDIQPPKEPPDNEIFKGYGF